MNKKRAYPASESEQTAKRFLLIPSSEFFNFLLVGFRDLFVFFSTHRLHFEAQALQPITFRRAVLLQDEPLVLDPASRVVEVAMEALGVAVVFVVQDGV